MYVSASESKGLIHDWIQEFILLSDVLGLSLLVDSIDHPKPKGSTEGTVLGPFHTHDAAQTAQGDLISHDTEGEPLLIVCTVAHINSGDTLNSTPKMQLLLHF